MKNSTLIFTLNLFLFVWTCQGVNAQNYKVAFGPRLGMSNGVSLKYVSKSPNTLEAILHSAHQGLRITGMYQYLRPFNGRTYTSGLHYFVGVGGHFANYNNFEYTDIDGFIKSASYQGFGVDLVAGLEYSFSAPLSLSIDFKPYYEVQTLELAPSHFLDVSLTIRHTFF